MRRSGLVIAMVLAIVVVPIVPALAADCSGCSGHRHTSWTDWGFYEDVHADHTNNHADEVIYKQKVHAALIQNTRNDNCYEGDYAWRDSGGPWYYREDSPILDSGEHGGYNDTWTHASGHDWWDDGVHWYVKEENDWCKSF